jgi:hypothetical protein
MRYEQEVIFVYSLVDDQVTAIRALRNPDKTYPALGETGGVV